MKTYLILMLVATGLLLGACAKKTETPEGTPAADNPFFAEYDTPFKVPPFDKIKPEHFVPAFEKGMEEQKAEIDKITGNAEAPTFEITVAALDRTEKLLTKVSKVFFGLSGANTNDEIKRLKAELKRVTEERDILKKAAAYFAKDHG